MAHSAYLTIWRPLKNFSGSSSIKVSAWTDNWALVQFLLLCRCWWRDVFRDWTGCVWPHNNGQHESRSLPEKAGLCKFQNTGGEVLRLIQRGCLMSSYELLKCSCSALLVSRKECMPHCRGGMSPSGYAKRAHKLKWLTLILLFADGERYYQMKRNFRKLDLMPVYCGWRSLIRLGVI